ncbi:lytic murein transglycosylase [Micromonospora sp. NPDC093277]|uniref:lytic transglycosylase domain-containing protein n=1 Tax=Micromonospora sp. NPDC093277 TaxID=3364291 RepID=UPI003804D7B1
MADGEERSMIRPLRRAVPPDGVAVPVPRPRSARERTAAGGAATASEPVATTSESATAASAERPVKAAAPSGPREVATGADPEATTPGTAPKDATATPESKDAGAGGEPAQAAAVAEPKEGESTAGRRRRVPFAHAFRMPSPRQLAVASARATRAWSRRPSGRTTLGGLFLLALVAATVVAGALVVPATVGKPRQSAGDATATGPSGGVPADGAMPGTTPTGVPGATDLWPTTPPPDAGQTTGPVVGPIGRPADALAGWATGVSLKTGIPIVAVQAYGYAELVLRDTHRSCQLSWTTLAAIGYVESRHGSANGATLRPDGVASPEIRGDPLDGQGGRSKILDTDKGQLDGDTVYDRAIGPMQFIPSTWQEIGADADNDGAKNPHNINDAALAAGQYLCKNGRNMTIPGDWWGAILSYNDVRRYAQDVFNKADEYGRLSGT